MDINDLRVDRRAVLAGSMATGLLSLLPGDAFAANIRRGGVLKYSTLDLDTADPHRHTGSIAVQQLYAEALTSIGPDGAVEPFLAKSIKISEDGKTYTFELRDGVMFHNGDVMTAADVMANIERVRTKIKGGWLANAMKLVDTVTAPNPQTIVVAMREPYAPLANLMSELWILSPRSEGWDETIKLPIGTGPFRFGEWQPNVKLIAPAHDKYWRKGLPYLSAVEADLRDATDKTLALRAGDMHLANVSSEMARQLSKDPNFTVEGLKDASWFFVSFNNRKPRKPFDDIRVRQAISYAIDKTAFMNFAAAGTGVVNNQFVLPGNQYFDQAVRDADPHVKADLEKARALLKEAGVDPTKETIELISWQNTWPQVIVQMVRKLGFNVNHVALDNLGAHKRLTQYDWDMNCLWSGPRADIFMRYVRLMSDGPSPELWGGIQDPELDKLLKTAVGTTDLAARRALYLQASERVREKYYFLVLGLASSQIAMSKRVRGYEPGATWSPNWASGGIAQTWLAE